MSIKVSYTYCEWSDKEMIRNQIKKCESDEKEKKEQEPVTEKETSDNII